jgi:hypothetical protein
MDDLQGQIKQVGVLELVFGGKFSGHALKTMSAVCSEAETTKLGTSPQSHC